MIIDGKHAAMGRLSSTVAKELLKGNDVIIVNAERVIITGSHASIKKKYLEQRRRGSPHHGPFFPKTPNLILRRVIRGMLPYKKEKGRTAMKKLRIYIGFPSELQQQETVSLAKEVQSDFITLAELSKVLGWKDR
ncbi:MAG: 50S ribosomal protein L13 [Candidatus Aenigmarchaeota archaeon]|nr:50S ribosomal protein L13 [Candidatus Aenigmarchaeota archaeon]